MWSEEEMCEIEPEAPTRRTGAKYLANGLRQALSAQNIARAHSRAHELTGGARPSVIYAPDGGGHGNFIDGSYRRICANPGWRARLTKAHTSKRMARRSGPDESIRAWCELDSANSSDALLMNVFCYPRVLGGARLRTLMGVEAGQEAEFGFRPRLALERGVGSNANGAGRFEPARFEPDRTEIDMRLGSLLVEAKLTEADFQFAPLRLVERYPGFDEVFDRDGLEVTRRGVRSYQLIRGVLAAHGVELASGKAARFCVLCDARRPDLIEAWFDVMRAVRSFEMQARLRLLTWQELVPALPPPLQVFLGEKYGLYPDGGTAESEERRGKRPSS